MSLYISLRAKVYIDHIKNRPHAARKILAAMEFDKKVMSLVPVRSRILQRMDVSRRGRLGSPSVFGMMVG
jgi:hypothetical protein